MAQLTEDYENLVGDVLVSAGMIAYSGPFTPDFRQKLVKGWQEKLVELEIPHSDGCDVRLTLADPVQARVFTDNSGLFSTFGIRFTARSRHVSRLVSRAC